jgi:ribose/xylose/arabinose/galactoside ABC-type transport system permease subunit
MAQDLVAVRLMVVVKVERMDKTATQLQSIVAAAAAVLVVHQAHQAQEQDLQADLELSS